MQATPDVIERRTKPRQRIGLLVDVPELDRPRPRQQLVALPVDAGVTDGAAGVVVDGKAGRHLCAFRVGVGSRPQALASGARTAAGSSLRCRRGRGAVEGVRDKLATRFRTAPIRATHPACHNSA